MGLLEDFAKNKAAVSKPQVGVSSPAAFDIPAGNLLENMQLVSPTDRATAEAHAQKYKEAKIKSDQSAIDAKKAAPSFTSVLAGIPNALIHPTKVAGQFGNIALGAAEGTLNAVGNSIANINLLNPLSYAPGNTWTQADINTHPELKARGVTPGTPKVTTTFGDIGSQIDRAAFETVAMNASHGSLDSTQAGSLYDAYLAPRKTARAVGDFASIFLPYEAADQIATRGLAYAAPKFAETYKLGSKVLTSALAFNAADQAIMSPTTGGIDRLKQVPIDTALGALFPLAGAAFKGLKGKIFRPIQETEFAAKEAIVEPYAGANSSGKVKASPETPKAVVTTPNGHIAMSTNDVNAVRNYIKDSGKTNIVIDQKPAGTLGVTKEGLPITANHVFDPKTGTHTITVTNLTDAQTFAHEWGHYINDQVASQVRGLSNYLLGDASVVKNVQTIEDTLQSLAIKQLGDAGHTTITNDMVDRAVSDLVTKMRSDIQSLSALRPDPRKKISGAKAFSEKFSDAVSAVLTGPSAHRNTTLYKFLNEAGVVDANFVRSIRDAARGAVEAPKQTPLEAAQARKAAAIQEKVAMGGELPKRPTRPSSKFEQTAIQKEELKFKDVVKQPVVARSEQGVANAIAKEKIPGKNLVEFSAGDNKPVTVVVHAIDRDIIRAIQSGGNSKYMDFVRKEVINEFGFSEKQADAYIASRFRELKAFAEAHAQPNAYVLAKAVRSSSGDATVAGANAAPDAAKKLAQETKKSISDARKVVKESKTALSEAKKAQKSAETDAAKAKAEKVVADAQKTLDTATEKVKQLEAQDISPAAEASRQKALVSAQDAAQKEAAVTGDFGNGPGAGGGEGPLRVNLDRMETGKKPSTDPFRADVMASSADQEVFLNTKVLPEITGKFRVGRSNESIIQDAMRADMTEGDFLKILQERVGALTPDTRAGFNMAMDKARNLQAMLGGRSAADLTAEELSAFKQELSQVTQLFEVYSGIRTEASNLLRSFGIAYDRGEDDVLRTIFEDLQKKGIASEADVWRAMADTYKTMNENKRFKEYLKALYASWLSGPATSLRNTVGNLSNVIHEIASAGVDPKRMKEVPTMVHGFFDGLVNKGLPDARAALRGELQTSGKFTSVYDPQFPLPEDAFRNTPRSTYDRITESVGRFLNAQDLAVSAAVRQMEENAVKVYRPEISADISKAITEMYGLSSVYRGMPKGRTLRALVMGTETATREAPLLKIFVPFIRTIGNVLDRQFDYIPVFSALRGRESVIGEQARIIAKKYGLHSQDEIRLITERLKDQQRGRMYLGFALTAGAAGLAANDKISGVGPSNYNERIQLERTGWRRNSIKVGNIWVPYTYFGPATGILSMAGNIHDAIKYENTSSKSLPTLVSHGMIGWMQTQLDMSFLKGISDLLGVATGNTNPETYLKNLGTSLIPIPNAYSQTLNMSRNVWSHIVDDPTLRQQYQTKNIMDAVRVKLGVTGSILGLPALSPRSDMFGQPLTLDFIYGLSPTIDKSAAMPVDNFLINNGAVITIPPKNQTFSFRGKDVKMTSDQYDEYVTTTGQAIYKKLQSRLPAMQHLSGDKLQNYIDSIVRAEREKARNHILSSR